MCIKDNYNKIITSSSYSEISNFIDTNCNVDNKNHCPKLCGGCNYLGFLEDRLKEIESE